MKHELADDERSEQQGAHSYRWDLGTNGEPMVSLELPSSSHSGAGERRRSRRDKIPAMAFSIRSDDANVDEICRNTLHKLVAVGCIHSNVRYSLEQFQVAEKDLQHLKKYGLVHAKASTLLHPILHSYEMQKAGADVGKITVILNVNLA